MGKKSIKLTNFPPVVQLTCIGLGHLLVPFAGIASPLNAASTTDTESRSCLHLGLPFLAPVEESVPQKG